MISSGSASRQIARVRGNGGDIPQGGCHNQVMSPDLESCACGLPRLVMRRSSSRWPGTPGVIEDWPLPDPDSDEVASLLPAAGEVPVVAVDDAGVRLGAGVDVSP